MFEGLTKAFNNLCDKLSLNMLIIGSLILVALLLCWCIVSLLVNKHISMKRNCVKCIKLLQNEGLNRDNYSAFSGIFAKFPTSVRFNWKKYEQKKTGRASDYLFKGEPLGNQLNGEVRQTRSLMRIAISVASMCLAVLSLALIGSTAVKSGNTANLTNTLVAEALILPILFYIFCMVIYYLYALFRNLGYKNLIETYYDLVDYLDEKVDLEDIFGAKNTAVGLISSVYTNVTLQELVDSKKKQQKRTVLSVEESGKTSKLSNLNNGVLGQSDAEDKTEENVVQSFEKVNTVLEPKVSSGKELPKIKNEAEFVETISEVEELVDTIGKVKDKKERTELEKTVNKKIKALTDYKQKAKSQKESVAVKKTTKSK